MMMNQFVVVWAGGYKYLCMEAGTSIRAWEVVKLLQRP